MKIEDITPLLIATGLRGCIFYPLRNSLQTSSLLVLQEIYHTSRYAGVLLV
jgi:hypothetical protein